MRKVQSQRKTECRNCIFILLLALLLSCLLSGCSLQNKKGKNSYQIFNVTKDYTKVVSHEYLTDTVNTVVNADKLITELTGELSVISEKPEYVNPMSTFCILRGWTLEDRKLTLDFEESYRKQMIIQEVLCRAAIVRTLTQLKGVESIEFTVQGEPLKDSQDRPVGTMTAEIFIDNAGTEISAYEEAQLHLYFASADGRQLISQFRDVRYSSNIALEKVVMEELITGPRDDLDESGIYPVINPATTIQGVTIKDGVCYINLSKEFLTQIYNVTSDVAIYSIANSMAELPNVNKVQISVDGETNVNFRDNVSLTTVFERNLDIVKK